MKYAVAGFRVGDGQLEVTNNYTRLDESVEHLSFWAYIEYSNSKEYSEIVIVCIDEE